jgi:cellulose/xylan binding protein with CBM9 domain
MKTGLIGVIFLFLSSFLMADETEPLIVPQPKHMEEGRWDMRISGKNNVSAKILIEPGKPMLRLGAEEINKYIEKFGGRKLPVEEIGSESPGTQMKIYLISDVEKSPLAKKFSLSDVHIPEEKRSSQAYLIRFQDNSILLAGYGEQGGLYAAITFCHLLKNKNGLLYAYKTNIDDYPDFPYRGGQRPGSVFFTRGYLYNKKMLHTDRSYIESMKEYIDIGLHLKLNFVLAKQNNFVHNSHDYSGEINQYAKERGFLVDSSFVNASFFKDKKELESHLRKTGRTKKDFMCLRGTYFCWSKDDLLRKMLKDSIKNKNINVWSYHCPDTGDENWGARCDECRKKFGSDRIKANAHVINLFYNELKKINPDIRMSVTLQPYTPFGMNPDYDEYYEDNLEHFSGIAELIPKDIWILAREADRESIKIWHKTTNRPTYLCFFPTRSALASLFSSNIRTLKTYYFPGRKEDSLFVITNQISWYLDTPLVAEYSWNTEAPGSAFLDLSNRYEFDPCGKTDPDLFNKIIPRGAHYIWGKEAAPLVTKIHQSGLNINLVVNPFKAQKRLNKLYFGKKQDSSAELNPEDFAFQEKAAEKVSRLCLSIMEGKVPVDHDFLVGDATRLYKHATAAKLLAPVYQHYFAAVNAVEEGDLSKASEEITLAKKINSMIKDKLEKEKSFVKQFAQVSPSFLASSLRALKPFELASKKLNQFELPTQEQINKTVMPRSLLKEIKNRVIKAVPVKKAPVIDGELNDACWLKHKYTVKHFVKYPFIGTPKLALDQSEVKICYDKEKLYVSFYAYDTDADSLVGKEHPRDSEVLLKEDIVEVFINANRNNKNIAQFIVNTVGSKLDAFNVAKTKGKLSATYVKEWNPNWQISTRVLRDGWIAEIAIPFDVFTKGVSTEIDGSPKPGDIWRINLTREKRTLELSGIKYMENSGFHAVEKYAKLLFVDQ